MNLLFLHGPPACGELTVARAIEARIGWPVFHNHLVVNAVSALFPFGSPNFVRLRDDFWLAAFDAAAAEGRSFIFTFAPEKTLSAEFPEQAKAAVTARGGHGAVRGAGGFGGGDRGAGGRRSAWQARQAQFARDACGP